MENIAKALVKAQAKLHNLGKNAEGYNYGYLTLDKLIDETRGVLAECGLVIVQPMGVTQSGQPVVETFLLHESGECITGRYPISAVTMKQCNDAQQMGAAITYGRRYSLAAMLNIAQADDDGACIGQGNKQKEPAQTDSQRPDPQPARDSFKTRAEAAVEAHKEMLEKYPDIKKWIEAAMEDGNFSDVVNYFNQNSQG